MSAEKEKTTKAMSLWVSIMGKRSGNGVEAAVAPRVAAADAAHGKPGAVAGAVALDGLGRVLRTGRGEAAVVAPPRAQHQAIGADQRQQQPLHVSARSGGGRAARPLPW